MKTTNLVILHRDTDRRTPIHRRHWFPTSTTLTTVRRRRLLRRRTLTTSPISLRNRRFPTTDTPPDRRLRSCTTTLTIHTLPRLFTNTLINPILPSPTGQRWRSTPKQTLISPSPSATAKSFLSLPIPTIPLKYDPSDPQSLSVFALICN